MLIESGPRLNIMLITTSSRIESAVWQGHISAATGLHSDIHVKKPCPFILVFNLQSFILSIFMHSLIIIRLHDPRCGKIGVTDALLVVHTTDYCSDR